ncbi:MAG: hypothetical protein AAGA61_03465 [Pseudomonadota bacterium]
MQGTRNPFVASEGTPFLVALAVVTAVVANYFGVLLALVPAATFVYLFLIFRDPHRPVPAVPLGVVSPVDGKIVSISRTNSSILGEDALSIAIAVNSLGTYTARCPVEGKIMDLAAENGGERSAADRPGLWVRTDESDDVVLCFRGHRFGLSPRAFIRYGERVGQGQRCAFLRLTAVAEVLVPAVARLQVEEGQSVIAGTDVLAKLPPS